jgi:hypothetical protein
LFHFYVCEENLDELLNRLNKDVENLPHLPLTQVEEFTENFLLPFVNAVMKNDKVRRNRLLYVQVNFFFQTLFDQIISIFSCNFNDRSKLYDVLLGILNPEHSFYSLNNLDEKDTMNELLEPITSNSSVIVRINKVILFFILLFCSLFSTDVECCWEFRKK